MTHEAFERVLQEQLTLCTDILCRKSKEYSTDADKLHNFKTAAAVQGVTQIQALSGMMAKHTVSVYDMCMSGKSYPIPLWEEKITDSINYLLLLKGIIVEESDKPTEVVADDLDMGEEDVSEPEPIKGKYEGLRNEELTHLICETYKHVSCDPCPLVAQQGEDCKCSMAYMRDQSTEFRKIAISYLEGEGKA